MKQRKYPTAIPRFLVIFLILTFLSSTSPSAKDKWEVDSVKRQSNYTQIEAILTGESFEEVEKIADEINKTAEEQKTVYLRVKEKGGKWEEINLELISHLSPALTRITQGLHDEEPELAKEYSRSLTGDEKRNRKEVSFYGVTLVISTKNIVSDELVVIATVFRIKGEDPYREGEVLVYIK